MRVKDLCRRLKPVLGYQVDLLWSIYLADQTAAGRAEIEQTLELLAQQHLGTGYEPDLTPFPPPPEAVATSGELGLGQVQYAGSSRYPFSLPIDRLREHVLVAGRSGSGKSNLTLVLMEQAMRRGVHVLALDWKRSYRGLVDRWPELPVYTVGRELSPMRFNPLIPPKGTEPGVWQKTLIQVLAKAYLGVISLLTAGLDELYRDAGVFDGRVERWPTVSDLLTWLHSRKLTGRAAMWKASAERILQALTYGEFGRVLDTQDRTAVDDLLDGSAVLEMDGLASSADRTFFAEALTLYLYRTRLAEGPSDRLRNLIVLEEAHHLLLAGQPGSGESGLETALRMVREYGMGFVIVDQSPSMLSRTAFANTYAMFALSQKLAADVKSMAGAMTLDDDQQTAIKRLPVGHAVVRLADGFPEPFLIEAPPSGVSARAVTDERIAASTRRKQSTILDPDEPPFRGDPGDLAVIPSPDGPSAAVTPIPDPDKKQKQALPEDGIPIDSDSTAVSESAKANEPSNQPRPPPPTPTPTPERSAEGKRHESGGGVASQPGAGEDNGEPPTPSRETLRFLADVAHHRLSTTVTRYERLRLSRRRGNAVRQELIKSGLVQPVALPPRSGQVVLLDLTDAGRSFARRCGIEPGPAPATSLEHAFWVDRAAEHFRRDGYDIELESGVGRGRSIDLVARRENRRVAVEIETGKSDLQANLDKLAHGEFVRRIVLATSPQAAAACQRAVSAYAGKDGVAFELWSWLDVS